MSFARSAPAKVFLTYDTYGDATKRRRQPMLKLSASAKASILHGRHTFLDAHDDLGESSVVDACGRVIGVPAYDAVKQLFNSCERLYGLSPVTDKNMLDDVAGLLYLVPFDTISIPVEFHVQVQAAVRESMVLVRQEVQYLSGLKGQAAVDLAVDSAHIEISYTQPPSNVDSPWCVDIGIALSGMNSEGSLFWLPLTSLIVEALKQDWANIVSDVARRVRIPESCEFYDVLLLTLMDVHTFLTVT